MVAAPFLKALLPPFSLRMCVSYRGPPRPIAEGEVYSRVKELKFPNLCTSHTLCVAYSMSFFWHGCASGRETIGLDSKCVKIFLFQELYFLSVFFACKYQQTRSSMSHLGFFLHRDAHSAEACDPSTSRLCHFQLDIS